MFLKLLKNCFTYLLLAAFLCNSLNFVLARSAEGLSVTTLRTEYKDNPVGIDVLKPRLSWQLHSDRRNVTQKAYQITVALSESDLIAGRKLIWDSKKIDSDESVNRVYAGPALKPSQRYFWRVRVWDEAGAESAWSNASYFEMGLLSPNDWQAKWIESGRLEDTSKSQPSPYLRGTFKLAGAIRSARAYVTSHGLYELHLNGKRVGDQFFTPGWTSYNKRLQYQTYDVTSLLQKGDNVAGVILGDGWYRGNIGFSGNRRNFYGDRLGLLMQIQVQYENGQVETFGTNQNWKGSTGPIQMSEIYHGETYDARLEKSGWDTTAFDDNGWSAVKVANYSNSNLIAPQGPSVRKHEELTPIAIIRTPAGDTVADMGQNMVGWVRLKTQGPAGTTVTLRHAEVLDAARPVVLVNSFASGGALFSLVLRVA